MNSMEERRIDIMRNIQSPAIKKEIVRSLQTAEGNVPCFGARKAALCQDFNCFWRKECLQQHQS